MNIFGQLRLVVLVRRGVIALEKIADAHESVAQILLDQQRRDHPDSRKPRATELYQFDPAVAEREWLREREEAAEAATDDANGLR